MRDIEQKQAHLQAMHKGLGSLLEPCADQGGGSACPILDTLNDQKRKPSVAGDEMTNADRRFRMVGAVSLFMAALASLLVITGVPNGALSAEVSTPSEQQIEFKFVIVPVEGMICISCAATIRGAIKRMEGVFNVEVDLKNRLARVTYVPAKLSPDRIVAAINKLGFKAGTPQETQ